MNDLIRLEELVDTFDRNREAYLSGKFNETQVRVEFINPFFELLGWDVHNKQGYAESYKDVYHEDAVLIKGATKAPDYAFRIGGTRKFFLEAKKPSINIKGDPGPAFQLRRYGWSAKLPLSILTDFEEFAVYDCSVKPNQKDKSSKARTKYWTYDEYVDNWDEINSIFSREAVLKGSFDKYADSHKAKRGTAEVDNAFLNEIEGWRDSLARNLALRNPALTQRELNFSVLRIIDRIIFLRMCEDREIEPYGQLQSLLNGTQVYPRLTQYFRSADDKYNSGLFHFKSEKSRPTEPDELTLNLNIDDKVLKDIFKTVYYPESPYEFSVFPLEILGQVYEQFLGKVITLTAKHQAKIEERPEVKKAGGVYYTPKYIVDYIVEKTIGKLLEGKKPGSKAVKDLKVLDPACGSGSFLLGAYQFILTWYRDQYYKAGPDKHKKVLYQTQGGEWRLTTAERKRILLQHIYGVDIDIQAVETSKLSLLLKVLEGESGETLKRQLALFKERALPDLGNNIKCGNSLIGPDYYDGQQTGLFDEEEQYRINVFDWQSEFSEIMKSGGFDAVIGNPPYVRQETLGDDKEYFQKKFKVYHGMADLYAYFIEKGMSLVKKGGYFSYIVSNKWMRANYGEALRAWLQKQCIEEIVDFGDLPVFLKATTYPCILRVLKEKPKEIIQVTEVKSLSFLKLDEYVMERQFEVSQALLDKTCWSLTGKSKRDLLDKIDTQSTTLKNYVGKDAFYGIKTGLTKAFLIDKKTRDELIKGDIKARELIKPFIIGRDIKRYKNPAKGRFLIFIPKGWTNSQCAIDCDKWSWFEDEYPTIASHLLPYKKAAQNRSDMGDYWWELRACGYYSEFDKPKILYLRFQVKPAFIFDCSGVYCNDAVWLIPKEDKYLLGILNSNMGWFLISQYCTQIKNGYQLLYKYLKKIPIRQIDFSNPDEKYKHDKMVDLVEGILELNKRLVEAKTGHEKSVLQRQIDATDQQIDQLVYELYELTEDEIKIVEESVKH